DWRRHNIFQHDEQASLYPYEQRFAAPDDVSQVHVRRGFIGLGQIEDYAARIVFRHEHTLSAPKADRLNLLRATRAHFGQIFMLYSDHERRVDSLLWGTPGLPLIDITDEYGVQHVVRQVSDRSVITNVQSLMSDRQLIIADGHHRYETALNYRNERRKECGDRSDPNQPYERVMMTFVNLNGEGIMILPTHRVVSGLERFDVAKTVERLRRYFMVNPLRDRVTGPSASQLLARADHQSTPMVAVTPRGDFILQSRPEADSAPALAGVSARQRQLDVVKLHQIVLHDVLGISPEDIRSQKHVRYYRDADEAISQVANGSDIAFLMNPATIDQVREIALAGEVMPQKSTDFYPKLLSGLTIYALE
ncbi:MAG: DUF1015 domain-containing protein, partial [Terriglobales bacterium]